MKEYQILVQATSTGRWFPAQLMHNNFQKKENAVEMLNELRSRGSDRRGRVYKYKLVEREVTEWKDCE